MESMGLSPHVFLNGIRELTDVIRQETKVHVEELHGRADGADRRLDKSECRLDKSECRLDKSEYRLNALELKLKQIDASLNNGQNHNNFRENVESRQNEERHENGLIMELEETPNGRLVCPLCRKDYSKKYIKKHIEVVCYPKLRL